MQIKVELKDHMGSDLTTVNAARVSFDKESEWGFADWREGKLYLKDSDEKLINYLAKHKHFTPFGHSFMSFRVTAPVFVRAQLVKHEYLRMNEISRRYVDSEPEFYFPSKWRKRAENVKQGSSDEFFEGALEKQTNYSYEVFIADAINLYNEYIDDGMAPEQARMVLPQSMMTSWWWSGSLDAFAKMCKLRLDPHAQYETRIVAEEINKIASGLFPVSWRALIEI